MLKAFDRDRGKKSKKGRKAVRKSSKKLKRGRKEKDLTPDRSVESLVEELVGSGVIRSFNWTSIDRFIGAVGTVDPMKRKCKRDSFPSNGDIRIAFIEHCLLSLGKSSRCLIDLLDLVELIIQFYSILFKYSYCCPVRFNWIKMIKYQ